VTRRSRWFRRAAIAVIAAATSGQAGQTARPLTVIAYGDMRFTDSSNVTAANPVARRILVERIAQEKPDAVVLGGDVPWRGGTVADYGAFQIETRSWQTAGLRVLPALGNHEFSGCEPAVCLDHWWTAFPQLRGMRWYAVDLAQGVRVIALDTMSSLAPDSEQRIWLEHEIATLPPGVQFVLIALHHPPVADVQTRIEVSHNPRPNEISLGEYLGDAARSSRARFIVIAGHIHNYERLLRDGVMYLVSGGGGAKPVDIDRAAADLHHGIEFPNFHYVKLTVANGRLGGEMYRLDEPDAPAPHFTVKDRFEIEAPALTSQHQTPNDHRH
jgi:Calcineurin-like phosphoesterase